MKPDTQPNTIKPCYKYFQYRLMAAVWPITPDSRLATLCWRWTALMCTIFDTRMPRTWLCAPETMLKWRLRVTEAQLGGRTLRRWEICHKLVPGTRAPWQRHLWRTSSSRLVSPPATVTTTRLSPLYVHLIDYDWRLNNNWVIPVLFSAEQQRVSAAATGRSRCQEYCEQAIQHTGRYL